MDSSASSFQHVVIPWRNLAQKAAPESLKHCAEAPVCDRSSLYLTSQDGGSALGMVAHTHGAFL